MTTKALEVTVKIGEDKFTGVGSCQIATVADILELLQTKPDSVVNKFNAAVEQAARAEIRNKIVSEKGAPQKALEKTAKDLFNARKVVGKPITMEAATEMAKQMLAA